ncbi:hypothetical protein HF1_12420 [Mycoplasma haemofelis str. Langford 1]|uniref:Uncharacterized protein n=1 Tax=Mycoplasma haemofelis (strain Langford 1) TaxID=941640 RepID=E8ZJC9_MYCHL|nr:hypothetical protein [Mycoplasma haemofelis]CBY93250.1 hypothetical protein HF1_12420 [Mycoplasma haemofelis str. Langford 1]
MPNQIVTKSLLGVLGVSAIGGTAAASYKLLGKGSNREEITTSEIRKSKISVADLLKRDSTKELLDKNWGAHDSSWISAYEKYRTWGSSNNSNSWNIASLEGQVFQIGEVPPREFLDKCEEESQREVDDMNDPIYVAVSEWCTKKIPVTAAQSSTP